MDELAALLASEGFVAAEEEAAELRAAAGGDERRLHAMVERRRTGEPLAWITGTVEFCGLTLAVHPGVYVPRWHTELVAEHAAERLPHDGLAIDACTGCGAVAATLMARRPHARVLAADIDPRAVVNARANGVDAREGDLFAPFAGGGEPRGGALAHVVVAVVPYVPTRALPLLQRDTFTFETALAYDGGDDGLDIVRRAIREAPLKPQGTLILEIGGAQAGLLEADLEQAAYDDVEELVDEYGDVRGVSASKSDRTASK